MKFRFYGSVVICLLAASLASQAQTKWYKFSKDFIDKYYAADSAIGTIETKDDAPAKNVHSISCGGNDGELHIGVPGHGLPAPGGHPMSAPADESADPIEFGLVAEPVNLSAATKNAAQALKGQEATFEGYYRAWNEGHDTESGAPSNPPHVLEVHPVWAFEGAGNKIDVPDSIHPMATRTGTVYQGYGASKFRPLLESMTREEWLHVYEDDTFVYVELARASNFYQLPVQVNDDVHDVHGGVEVTVDVFSDASHRNRVLDGLHVVANNGSEIASQIKNGEDIGFLLGIFSVNLHKAKELAAGHDVNNPAFAPSALEFFTYGRPLGRAVSTCNK